MFEETRLAYFYFALKQLFMQYSVFDCINEKMQLLTYNETMHCFIQAVPSFHRKGSQTKNPPHFRLAAW